MKGITIEMLRANDRFIGANHFVGVNDYFVGANGHSPLQEPKFSNAIAQDLRIIDIESFSNFAIQIGETFESYYYTNLERSVDDFGARRIQYLAGRFAAKSAIALILGKQDDRDNIWLDIEIQRLSSGAPSVKLSDRFQEIAEQLGINKWLLSISHTSVYAAAMAIAVR
jgi:holo-[acyl-carrier protein] synthase